MQLTNYKAVIFDMDGVLIDAREWHYEALNQALAIFGIEINLTDHAAIYNGLSTKQKLELLSAKELLPAELHGVIEAVKQDRTLRIAAQRCFPNVAHQILISKLKSRGLKVGVVTNSIRRSTEFMLGYAGLLDSLDVIVTNEDVILGKPNPEGYQIAMQTLNSQPSETLVVEDGEYGILAAETAGAEVIRVTDPFEVNLELFLTRIPDLR